MSRPTRALIHTTALQHNLLQARQHNPGSKIMAVVKANAYGHGTVAAAKALSGADAFGVASIEEALVLRDAGIVQPITALEGFFESSELPYFVDHHIQAVIHSPWQLELLEGFPDKDKLGIWIKIDTGMNRLGFPLSDAAPVVERVRKWAGKDQISLMSHLACADDLHSKSTQSQIEHFSDLVSNYDLPASLSNSAGIVGWPASRHQWARPGIMLYGSSPISRQSAHDLGLKPAMTFTSELISVNHRRRGDAVGYGGDWICPEDMAVGVVAAGYGDGYPRHAQPGTPVLIRGKPAPIIGRVSMDMITVDLRHKQDAVVGDEVVLWGNGLSVDTVAEHAGTISYELLCHVTQRVPRIEVS